MLKILIVEDEPKVAALLKDYLGQSGYETIWVSNGLEVESTIKKENPDLVLLDIMLPGKDGIDVCKDIRLISSVPIIMITARIEEVDRLLGLELGADDYICKPFSPREVVARVKAIFRRLESNRSVEKPCSIRLVLDPARFTVSLDGQLIELTSVEFKLLHKLASDSGRIYSRQQLMDSIYEDNRVVSDRTIDSHIKKLRKKFFKSKNGDDIIRSVYGAGYKLEID